MISDVKTVGNSAKSDLELVVVGEIGFSAVVTARAQSDELLIGDNLDPGTLLWSHSASPVPCRATTVD